LKKLADQSSSKKRLLVPRSQNLKLGILGKNSYSAEDSLDTFPVTRSSFLLALLVEQASRSWVGELLRKEVTKAETGTVQEP